MRYLIRYHSQNGGYLYLASLSPKRPLRKKKDGKKGLCTFSSTKKARKAINGMRETKRTGFLKGLAKGNFEIVNENDQVVAPLFNSSKKTKENKEKKQTMTNDKPVAKAPELTKEDKMATELPPAVPTQSANDSTGVQGPSINEVFEYIREHKNHSLILDLEFFQDVLNGGIQRMGQIAGVVLGDNTAMFNGFVFDPHHMTTERQLYFLRGHNLTYNQALKCSSKAVMAKVVKFCEDHQIDTIISWGNAQDFKTLRNEGFADEILDNVKAIDLEQVFAQANGNNTNAGIRMSLENFCNLLNLPNDGKWHDALDDDMMIKRICDLYMTVLSTDKTPSTLDWFYHMDNFAKRTAVYDINDDLLGRLLIGNDNSLGADEARTVTHHHPLSPVPSDDEGNDVFTQTIPKFSFGLDDKKKKDHQPKINFEIDDKDDNSNTDMIDNYFKKGNFKKPEEDNEDKKGKNTENRNFFKGAVGNHMPRSISKDLGLDSLKGISEDDQKSNETPNDNDNDKIIFLDPSAKDKIDSFDPFIFLKDLFSDGKLTDDKDNHDDDKKGF